MKKITMLYMLCLMFWLVNTALAQNSVTLTSPNGGENWQANTNRTIIWTSTGTISNVQIEYSTNAGVNYSIITSSAPNTGSYTWTVPNSPTASARVKISNVASASTFDVSNSLFTISSPPLPKVTVTSPNGGEQWTAGTTRTITWTSTGTLSNVKIEYSVNGGGTYSEVVSSTANTGSYNWTVPNFPTASARIRISDPTNFFGTNDISNSFFTIAGAPLPTITVLSPNGGEQWAAGSMKTISWTSSNGTIANVKLEYTTNSGASWSTIITSTPNTGSYTWTVPNTPTASARVRVSDVLNETVTKDVSNNNFTILQQSSPTITVLSPNGGENWGIGSAATIRWSSTGTIANVKIEYSTNAGVSYSEITSSTSNTGSYSWTVPNSPTASARVRVSDVSNSSTIKDISNANFTIVNLTPVTITVGSPNGGENWEVGSTKMITWTSTGSLGNVKIEYSINSGVTYSMITTSTPNTGSYGWVVPNNLTASARIRISDATNITTASDVSNANFSIIPAPLPSITLATPNGGEQWIIGSSYNITWTSTGSIANVRLEYSINGGLSYSSIIVNTPNTGSYLWTIPNAATASARVRVSDAANVSATHDESNTNFSIINGAIPIITITSPNGGEQWTLGSIRTIMWTTTNVPSFNVVIVEYSVSGESGPYIPISTFAQNTGFYQWVVPTTLTNNARIRVTTVVNEVTATDVSNASFSITPALSLTLTAPRGFENWTVNSTRAITWTSAGAISNVKIEYSTNENLNFTVIAASVPNTGSYTWVVPSPVTTTATVRISDVVNPSILDLSDAYFIVSPEVPSVTVTSPNGGEVWNIGTSKTISWASTGEVANVRIEYSTDAGSSWSVITGSTPNDGNYSWSVLNTPSPYSRIRIASVTNPLNIYDVSDANFTIAAAAAPAITVTTPNGGENFVIGTYRNITWTSTGTLTNVKLEYSTNGGSTFSLITVNTANTGSYAWKVPSVVTASALVRITDVANTTSFDVSDANFNIVYATSPIITVTSPNGGEDWSIGTSKNITWTTANVPSFAMVKIEYSINGEEGPYNLIATNATNTGSYRWVVPGPISSAVRIRLTTSYREVVGTDVSNSNFTISPALSVTVTSPNGGENWVINSTKLITWTTTGNISKVKLDYSVNSGATFTQIATNIPNTGSYQWRVPGPATLYASVRISDVANPTTVRDWSETFFAMSRVISLSGDVRNQNELQLPEIDGEEIPAEFSVTQNYPNPFNPSTNISYQLPTDARVTLRVFNILGVEISTLVNSVQQAGFYDMNWDASRLSSGVYFYQLTAEPLADNFTRFHSVNKMLLTK